MEQLENGTLAIQKGDHKPSIFSKIENPLHQSFKDSADHFMAPNYTNLFPPFSIRDSPSEDKQLELDADYTAQVQEAPTPKSRIHPLVDLSRSATATYDKENLLDAAVEMWSNYLSWRIALFSSQPVTHMI